MGTKSFKNYKDLLTFSRASTGYALRPISYGSELVTNGTFATDSNWTKESPWTISSGRAFYDDSANGAISQTIASLQHGKVYEVSFEVTSYLGVPANLGIYAGSTSLVDSVDYSDGTHKACFVWQEDGAFSISSRSSNSGAYYLDNVSVKEVLFDTSDGTLTLFKHPDNIPRVEYDGSGNNLGLLIEAASTNLVTYSNDLTQWTNGQTTDTANQAVSPDGTQNATSVADNSSSGGHYIQSPNFTIASGAVTASVFAKKGTLSFIRLRFSSTTNQARAWFDLENGTVETVNDGTAEIEDVGNGWYRCTLHESANTAATGSANIRIYTNQSDGQGGYVGDGSNVYIYGMQVEQSEFITSYIETTGSSATRAAELAEVNTEFFGYNALSGSVVITANTKEDTAAASAGVVGTALGGRFLYLNANRAKMYNGTNVISGDTITAGTEFNVASAFSKRNQSIAVDGGTATSGFGGAWSSDDKLYIGRINTIDFYGHIKSIKYYPRCLTDEQLKDLSS